MNPVSPRLQALLRFLDTLQEQPPLAELTAAVARFPLDCEDVASFLRFNDEHYQRNLIRAGDHYHAWVLCWRNGQRSPIHDHAGSSCAVRVLRGTLTETRFEFAPNGDVKAVGSRDLSAGGVMGSVDGDLHQVSNLQAGDADLVTVHVYAPPLVGMHTFSIHDRSRGYEVWEVEFADAAGI